LKTRSKYLLAKIETVYGTDPTPAAANAIITSGLAREVYAGPVVSRENDRSTLGARQQLNTAPMVTQSFAVEFMGSGTLGTPPNMGVLLRACGMAETITASTMVEYEPVSASFESITNYYDRGSERQIAKGVRGNAGLSFVAGQIPKFNFQLKGLYAKPANQAPVTPAPTPNRSPYPVNKVNTTDCTIGVYDLILQSLELDFGQQVDHVNLVNYEEVLIGDRTMSGTIVCLAPHIGTKDMFALVEFQLIHGPATDIIQLDAPAMQLTGINEVDIFGEQGYSMTFNLIPVSGDDELKITFK
jgi:hypothetical protein